MTRFVPLIAIAFLAFNGYIFYFLNTPEDLPPRAGFDEFPLTIDGWRCAELQSMARKIEVRLGVTDYLLCDYWTQDPPNLISIYVGYHERQVREGAKSFAESSIHPPRHCLPGAGWSVIDSKVVKLETPGLPQDGAKINRLIIAKGNERRLVYYWYHSRGRIIADDYRKILYMVWDRATRGRTDGSLVRFTIPTYKNAEEAAEAAFRDLVPRILALLPRYVPD
jgi:EpsI family protein